MSLFDGDEMIKAFIDNVKTIKTLKHSSKEVAFAGISY